MTANEGESKGKRVGRGSLSPPATAYSRTGRKNQHYNLSEAKKNQFNNVNIRRLSQPPKELPQSRYTRKRNSAEEILTPSSPLKVRQSLPGKPSEPQFPPKDHPDPKDQKEANEPTEENVANSEQQQGEEAGDSGEEGSQVCPLSDPEFPPIAEIDHWVGRCFCHLCSCGEHICPMTFRRARLTQTALSTSYRNEFHKRDPVEPSHKCIVEVPYSPNQQPIDFLTTSQRDFQPFTVTAPVRSKPSTATTTMKFAFRTSYQSDFPNWGPNETAEEKHPQFPYRGNEVKMDLGTTYSTHYKLPPVQDSRDSRLPTPSVFPLSSTAEFCGETTAQKEFRTFEKRHMARLEGRPIEKPVLPESPGKVHFKTMYQTDFRGLQRNVYRRGHHSSSIS